MDQSKKLYFKQSATEALHSAILLKARNPSGLLTSSSTTAPSPSTLSPSNENNSQTATTTTTPIPSQSEIHKAQTNKLTLCPKLANTNTLLTISASMANSSQILNNLNSTLDLMNNNNTENSHQNDNFDFDEFDSPLKIKENILASIRNLKPSLVGLDPLRSSTSDDEDCHTDNTERKFKSFQQMDQDLNQENSIMNHDDNEVVLLSCSTKFTLPSTTNYHQKPVYLRASSTNSKNLTKLPNCAQNPKSSTVILNKAIRIKNTISTSASNKRGKEEALSNSSSSDEETENSSKILTPTIKHQSLINLPTSLKTNINSTFKLQQLVIKQIPPPITILNNKNNVLLTLNMNNSNQQYITPVVNSAKAAAAAALAPPPVPQFNISSYPDCELTNSPFSASTSSSTSPVSSSSFRSQKSSIDSDYESKYSTNSPTSCCSSQNTNDGIGIDLHDDNSSTASEPIYVRQPGFEHHAHEIVNDIMTSTKPQHTIQKMLSTPSPSSSKSFSNLNFNKPMAKLKKTETCSNLLNNLNSAPKTLSTNTKAKKKLCLMSSDVSNLNINGTNMNSDHFSDVNNELLKPISSKAKREPLPMRLRALPMSFWQQPNQPNVSPGAMYLPPLFKNEIDSVDDTITCVNIEDMAKLAYELLDSAPELNIAINNNSNSSHTRDTRYSAANPDLLFKLFDNIEQKERKQVQLQLQTQYKIHRSNQKPLKTLSKALTKGEDPCILDAVSEGLFPLLRLDPRNNETVNFLSLKATENTLNNLSSNGLSSSTPLIYGSLGGCAILSSSPLNTTNMNMNTLLSFNSNNNNNYSNSQTMSLHLHPEQNYTQELSEVVAAL